MSSTNHTTNYNLPQYVGSDKPAWLGDINPAFSAIDTAMHNNATTAAQGVSDAATANTAAGAAQTTADNAATAAGTAQTTANQAVAAASTNATKIAALEAKFILTSFTSVHVDMGTWGNDNTITLAKNSDGSVFKLYGWSFVHNWGGSSDLVVTMTAVPGLTGVYGIPTGLYVAAPDEAYTISNCGLTFEGRFPDKCTPWSSDIAVASNGQIYLFLGDTQTRTTSAGDDRRTNWSPCLYFNTNFGDTPTPNA